jgi:hypothetical protein
VTSKKAAAPKTAAQKAEAELTKFGLSLPETSMAPGWATTRFINVRTKSFCVFGEKDERPDELTMIVKLPISAGMVQDLYFVRESKGWFKQHDWVIAHFDAEDDVLAELPTLKGWMTQSYCVIAPKKLAKLVRGEA